MSAGAQHIAHGAHDEQHGARKPISRQRTFAQKPPDLRRDMRQRPGVKGQTLMDQASQTGLPALSSRISL